MKVRSATVAAVLAFLITWMMGAQDADADVYLEYGQLQNETDATFAGVGYTHLDKWDTSILFVGVGDRKDGRGKTPKLKIYSVSRLIYPTWTDHKFYMGIGLSKSEIKDNGSLIGVYNYKLQFGWDFGRSKLFYAHHSSGDVNDVNVGIDMIGFHFKI